MRAGCRVGKALRSRCGIGLFVDERGYTTVAVATALLVSVALVFCVAAAQWTLSRSADVQSVADAGALAGSNAVAGFCTVAQVVDACVLSMGLAGMASMGAGLVLAAIPGAQEASGKALDAGEKILDSRNSFARSSLEGLRVVEEALPGLVAMNSYRCVRANAQGSLGYTGIAVPFPLESQSDYSSLAQDVSGEGLSDSAGDLQDATKEAEEAKRRADESRRRAWIADCVDEPRCMRSRAQDLAGLVGASNPMVESPEQWTFGDAINRSRAYYAQRLAQEVPEAQDIESVTDSLAREAFYEYALDEVQAAWYREDSDGAVDLHVPHLARNSNEVRETWLYTDARWPCTEEEGGPTLHSSLSCPGALGPSIGSDCVAAVDAGSVLRCGECGMDVADLGAVASISTSANNGYEHYWQIVVEEAQTYERARNDQADAERRAKDVAERGADAFDRALEQLRVPRPRICPAGAWGCVCVATRASGSVPSELTDAFMESAELPAGVAVSASALAPDNNADGGDALSHLLDSLTGGNHGLVGSLMGGITGLWGRLLTSYGTAYENLGGMTDDFLGRLDGLFGSTLGSWLKRKVSGIMGTLGLEPADTRMRKPVLAGTADVLGRAGIEPTGKVRQLVQSLPAGGSPLQLARALGIWVWDQSLGRRVTLATLTIPGTSVQVPLALDLPTLAGDSE